MQHMNVELQYGQDKASLETYLLNGASDDGMERLRPLVIICPGGGYAFTSAREAEPVAVRINAMGMHAAVLWYSVSPAVFPVALMQLARAVAHARAHAEEWRVDPNRIIVLGFSAGGHLAASLGVFWHRDFVSEALALPSGRIQPNGLVLCYPVITAGEHAHRDSFRNLTGGGADAGLLRLLSLEHQVTGRTPPTFLWHTYDDPGVPVENALLFADALRRAGVSLELHIYPHGAHGLSLSNEETCVPPERYAGYLDCASWVDLAERWLKRQ